MASRVISPVSAGCVIPKFTVHEKKPKVKLYDGFLRKLKREGTRFLFKRGRLERKKPMKKMARSRRREMAQYFALSTKFLLEPENENCQVCVRLRERSHNIRLQVATEVHHKFGRVGRSLCWVPGFVACCREHREWIHANPKLSREMGVLCEPAQWNVYQGD